MWGDGGVAGEEGLSRFIVKVLEVLEEVCGSRGIRGGEGEKE